MAVVLFQAFLSGAEVHLAGLEHEFDFFQRRRHGKLINLCVVQLYMAFGPGIRAG